MKQEHEQDLDLFLNTFKVCKVYAK